MRPSRRARKTGAPRPITPTNSETPHRAAAFGRRRAVLPPPAVRRTAPTRVRAWCASRVAGEAGATGFVVARRPRGLCGAGIDNGPYYCKCAYKQFGICACGPGRKTGGSTGGRRNPRNGSTYARARRCGKKAPDDETLRHRSAGKKEARDDPKTAPGLPGLARFASRGRALKH